MTRSDHNQRFALHRRTALRVVIYYALVTGAWIFFSDRMLARLINDPAVMTHAQTVKGLVFVLLTATLLFFYLRHCLKQFDTGEQEIKEEQAKAQANIAERLNQLKTLFDSMNAFIYVADIATYELLFVNRQLSDAFGENWQGRKCHDYLQEGFDQPCGFCNNNQLITGGEPGPPVAWEFRNTKNQRWYECFDKAIRWTNGRLARLEIAMDVTERKELEKTKDELLSSVSHEMRTPLTAITGFTELLLDEPGLTEDAKRRIGIIYREAGKMTDLVNSFIDAHRFKSDRARIDYEHLHLADLIERSMDANRDRQSHHVITLDIPDGLQVFGNRKELVQVFTQLLSNACRYSPQGGAIRVTGQADDHGTRISISDQGLGIPPHEQENIFKPFHRLDTGDRRRTGGVGMGLTLVRQIVTLHGGRVTLDSAPGQGSCFTVELPRPSDNSSPRTPTLAQPDQI